ncbi:DoxX family protein [Arcticibacter tournemirensis]|uniref:DoxX family protein n=1 Tax=Arcticibacter tournemirensis TaxID=699437 RepID=A0A4Q0M4W7_9SPHI|nr:DoxX family protein [Arcticibacter tournemirensis]RXF67769.1 DoxX family protein [Arcticibacter tournemirensis]
MLKKIIKTSPLPAVIIIRLMVGAVFLSEGIQKFIFADKLGAGRFEKIGLPEPDFLGYFVGTFEIACGLLVLLGFLTRLAAIPLLSIMLVALTATKVKLVAEDGFWSMLHDSRTDWSMLLGSIFLLIMGGGKWSIDRILWKKQKNDDA